MKNTDERFDDWFRPPAIPIEVECVECGEVYESSKMRWVPDGGPPGYAGAWCCPTPGCGGAGFLFDIWPTDPEWRDENGNRVCFESEEESFYEQQRFMDMMAAGGPVDTGDIEPKYITDDDDIPF